jgi:AraC-like DNA-binding protein
MSAPPSRVTDERLTELHADGLTAAEMAAAVGLSPRTVRDRLQRLRLVAHRPTKGADAQLHVRCTPADKARVLADAKAEGVTVSAYVLARCLP